MQAAEGAKEGAPVAVRPHWAALDGIRGCAVVLVVIHHLGLPPFRTGGFLGVELFFVLSGFLITALLVGEFRANERIRLGYFYARRFLRLYPAQLVLAAFVTVVALVAAPVDTRGDLLGGVPSSLLYFSNWVKAFGWWTQGALTHTWSLAIEEQYYLLWPPLALLAMRRWGPRGAIWAGLAGCVVTVAVRTSLWAAGAPVLRLYAGTDTRAPALLMGSVLGALVGLGVLRRVWRPEVLVTAGVGGTVLLSVLVDDTPRFLGVDLTAVDLLIVAGLAGAVFLPATSLPARILAVRPLVVLGRVSYGLYLWHKAIIVLFNGKRFGLVKWQEVLVEVALFSAATALSWKFIERPIHRLRHRFEVPVSAG